MSNDTKIFSLFAHGIFEGTLNIPEEDKVKMLDHIEWDVHKRNRDQDPDWFTQSKNRFLHKENNFKLFATTIEETASLYWNKLGYGRTEFFVTQMWGNSMKGRGEIGTHYHSNSIISGVFYFDVNEEDSGGTTFINPMFGLNQQISVPIESYSEYTRMNYTVPPKQNRLILFPSYIQHKSERCWNNNIRTTLSFNLLPKVLGNDADLNYYKLV